MVLTTLYMMRWTATIETFRLFFGLSGVYNRRSSESGKLYVSSPLLRVIPRS